jgi:hypothetical protein
MEASASGIHPWAQTRRSSNWASDPSELYKESELNKRTKFAKYKK